MVILTAGSILSLYVFLGVLLLTLIVLVGAFVLSRARIQKLENDLQQRPFILYNVKIDYNLNQVTFYPHRKVTTSLMVEYSAFNDAIANKDVAKWESYILSIKANTIVSDLKMEQKFIWNKQLHSYTYSLISKSNDNKKLFFKCYEEPYNKKELSFSLPPSILELKNDVGLIDFEKNAGAIVLFNITNYEKIKKLYNTQLANIYRQKVLKKISKVCGRLKTKLYTYSDNVYGTYLSLYSQKKHISRFTSLIQTEFFFPLSVGGFHFSPTFTYGVAFVGEFAKTVETICAQANQVLTEGKSVNNTNYYDITIHSENLELRKNLEKAQRAIANKDFKCSYSPLLNLVNGEVIAYRGFCLPKLSFDNLQDMKYYASKISKTKELADVIGNTILYDYYFNEIGIRAQKLFLEGSVEELNIFFRLITHNVNYQNLSVAFVLTDYLEQDENRELDEHLKALIAELKNQHISIYIKETPKMLTIDHFIYSLVDGVIFDKTILANIENISQQHYDFHLLKHKFSPSTVFLAFDVSKLATVEVLKNQDINIIEGSILGDPQVKPTPLEQKTLKKVMLAASRTPSTK